MALHAAAIAPPLPPGPGEAGPRPDHAPLGGAGPAQTTPLCSGGGGAACQATPLSRPGRGWALPAGFRRRAEAVARCGGLPWRSEGETDRPTDGLTDRPTPAP